MNQFHKVICIFIFTFFSIPAQAEQCWQVSGCDNLIGWVRINKYSYETMGKDIYTQGSQSLFGLESLPNVNSILKTKRLTKVRQIDWSDPINVDCHDHDYRKGEVAEACSSDIAAFDYLGESAVVRVLGYHKRKYLYVLVQVITYPQDPFRLQKERHKGFLDQDI